MSIDDDIWEVEEALKQKNLPEKKAYKRVTKYIADLETLNEKLLKTHKAIYQFKIMWDNL